MTTATHRVRYPLPRGPVAAPARAWGEEFDVVMGGGMANKPYSEAGDMAVVDIVGPLVQKSHWLFCSYDDLRTRFAAACESAQPTICLRINSPGGDFAGSLELSRELRAMAAVKGKRLVAFTDSQALSAGYALACAAEEIVITDSAFVGSVGVWAALADETARDRAMGLNIVIVPSGTQKAERNPHVAITEGAVSNLQAQVDDMAAMFFDLVSEQRGMPRAKVEALQGGEHFGTRAISLGLADRTVTGWADFTASKGVAMAKSTQEARAAYREALAKLAAADDDDGKEARSALAEMDKEDEKKMKKSEGEDDKKKEDDAEGKASAKAGDGDGDDDDAKAKAEGDEDEEKKGKAAAASPKLRIAASSTKLEIDLAARVHALETAAAEKELATEREALLASRPDFAPEVRAVFAAAPLAVVRDAVKNFKRVASPTQAAAAATVPGGTRGEGQGLANDERNAPETEVNYIDRKMGLAKASGGVTHRGTEMTLGYMSPEEAKAAALKLGEKGVL